MPPARYDERLPRRLTLRGLRILLAVAEAGSIRKAGQALHLTQPAVTAAVAELEDAVGARLFERLPTGVAPTVHGERFIGRAKAIMGELRLATEEIEAVSRGAAGGLSLGVVSSPAAGVAAAAVARLIARHPTAVWSIHEGRNDALRRQLKAREIDLAVVDLPADGAGDPDLTHAPLYEDGLCVLASRNHPLTAARRLTWADLAGQHWLMPEPGTPLEAYVADVLRGCGVTMPDFAPCTASVSLRSAILARGEPGMLTFGMRVQHAFSAVGSLLVMLDVDLPARTHVYGLATLKGRALPPLGEHLAAEIRRLAAAVPSPAASGPTVPPDPSRRRARPPARR